MVRASSAGATVSRIGRVRRGQRDACEGQRGTFLTAGNAQEVADTVLRIIETPAGEKQLRSFVGPQNFGVDEINALSKQVQTNVLEAFGLTADIEFLKGKAVGSV